MPRAAVSADVAPKSGAASPKGRAPAFPNPLQPGDEYFRALIENSSDYIMIVAASSEILYVGPSSERLLGFTQEEMLGQLADELVHPDDLPLVYERLGWIVEHPGQVASVEFRIRHKDGSWRVFENNGRTLLPDSAAAGVVSNGRDVTERRRVEEELERQKRFYEDILNGIDAGIAVFDQYGRYEYVSTRAVADPEIRRWMIGKTIDEYCRQRGLPEEVRHSRQKSLADAMASGVGNTTEQEMLGPDGQPRYWLRRLVPMRDERGQLTRFVGYSVDITDRRSAEMALERAKEEAERANRAKSEFLSRMSHELRTPMNAILGFAQVLERSGLRPEQGKYVGHILRGGRHLLRLINEVLEIARIEAGRLSLTTERIPIYGVLREALELVRPLAEQVHIVLDVDEEADAAAAVLADRQRLVQVLLNLLSNAIKYNRPGGQVHISWACAGDDAGRLLVRVRDTGRGLPTDRLDQLFTPFARLGAEQSDTEGTGLGLALSQRLAEAMGGGLTLESTSGQGSVFRLELRAGATAVCDDGLRESPVPADMGAAAQPATILYIEDNLTNLSLVETLLEAQPAWTALPALSGRAGIQLARERRPDLILLDLHLPDIQGDEVLRQLRADPATAAIPVIVVSADATPAAIRRLRAAGANAYLTKPIDLDEFLGTVGEQLGDAPPASV